MEIVVYVVITIIFVIGYLIKLGIKSKKKYEADMKHFSMQSGFKYEKKPNITLPSIKFFTSHRGTVIEKLTGTRSGTPWNIFNYQYVIHTGKSVSYVNTTFFVVTLESQLPQFFLWRENIFHKIGNLIGFSDINFPDFPLFSKKYRLKGEDVEKVKKFFTHERLRFFENNIQDFTIEALGRKLIFYHNGKKVKPDQLNLTIEKLEKIKNVLK